MSSSSAATNASSQHMMNSYDAPVMPAPPIAHAIGGSVGSTISMLLFYPLERVRIEMQAQAFNIRREHSNIDINIDFHGNVDVDVDVEDRDRDRDRDHDHDDSDCSAPFMKEFSKYNHCHNDDNDNSESGSELDKHCLNCIDDNVHNGDTDKDRGSGSGSGSGKTLQSPLQYHNKIKESDGNVNADSSSLSSTSYQMIPKTPSTSPTHSGVSPSSLPLQEQERTLSTSASTSTKATATSNSNPKKQLQLHKLFHKSSLLRTIYKLHIQKTLYKGSTPIALTLALSNFIFFYTLQTFKKMLTLKNQNPNSPSLLASTIAGVINVLITNPFWVANLRLVQGESGSGSGSGSEKSKSNSNSNSNTGTMGGDGPKGIIDCFREIIEKEGLAQLWAGTGASLLLVSNPAIQYYCYESAKMELLKTRLSPFGTVPSLRPIEAFMIGALAKGLATVITYPLQLSQLLMRLQKNDKKQHIQLEGDKDCGGNGNGCGNEKNSEISSRKLLGGKSTPLSRGGGFDTKRNRMEEKERQRESDGRAYTGLFDCMKTLYKHGGMKALYSGMDAKLIQTVLTSALTFLTYEQILDVVARSYWLFSKRLNS